MRRALITALSASAVLLLPTAAHALDEARIVSVSCTGVRVTQVGLPPGREFEVIILDAPRGVELGAVDVVSSAKGTIDVHVPADLRGVRQIVAEVEYEPEDDEYGEVGADLPQPCATGSPRPPALVPVPTVSSSSSALGHSPSALVGPVARGAGPPAASPGETSGPGSGLALVGALGLALVAAAAGAVVVGRRRRAG